jgi:hypothetical protein
MHPKITG